MNLEMWYVIKFYLSLVLVSYMYTYMRFTYSHYSNQERKPFVYFSGDIAETHKSKSFTQGYPDGKWESWDGCPGNGLNIKTMVKK